MNTPAAPESGKSTLWLRVSVPIASFTIPYAREFVESFPFPPPTTVYGMLLSYIGETNRFKYRGTRIAVRVIGIPAMSLVLRKFRRFKDKEVTSDKNSKPDYQTLLTNVNFLAGVQDPESDQAPSLVRELKAAFEQPHTINRFGGLSCGESHNLVDTISRLGDPSAIADEIWGLNPSKQGEWTIPLWVDHVGSEQTHWATATFEPVSFEAQTDQDYFVITPKLGA